MTKKVEEDLLGDLDDIEDKITIKRKETRESPEYTSLYNKIRELDSISDKKYREINELKKIATDKYIRDYKNSWRLVFTEQGIKSSVKEAIKRGLGIKYLNEMNGDDIIEVVKKLIDKDLEETNMKDILKEQEEIDKKVKEMNREKDKIEEEALRSLLEKRDEIQEKINKKTQKLDKSDKKKANNKLIKEKLPDLLENIQKEVRRGLLLDGIAK